MMMQRIRPMTTMCCVGKSMHLVVLQMGLRGGTPDETLSFILYFIVYKTEVVVVANRKRRNGNGHHYQSPVVTNIYISVWMEYTNGHVLPEYHTLDFATFSEMQWSLVACHWRRSVKLRDHWSMSLRTIIKSCFKGNDGHDALHQVLSDLIATTTTTASTADAAANADAKSHVDVSIDEETVVQCGQMLLDAGFIEHIKGREQYLSKKNHFYRFTEKTLQHRFALTESSSRSSRQQPPLPLPLKLLLLPPPPAQSISTPSHGVSDTRIEGSSSVVPRLIVPKSRSADDLLLKNSAASLSTANKRRQSPNSALFSVARRLYSNIHSGKYFGSTQQDALEDHHLHGDLFAMGTDREILGKDDNATAVDNDMNKAVLLRQDQYESLDTILQDSDVREIFRAFCVKDHSEEFVDFWTAVNCDLRPQMTALANNESGEEASDDNGILELLRDIQELYETYLKPGAARELNLVSHVQKRCQDLIALIADYKSGQQNQNLILDNVREMLRIAEKNALHDMHDIHGRFIDAIRELQQENKAKV